MNDPTHPSLVPASGYLNLLRFWNITRRYWVWVLACVATAAGAAAIYTWLLPFTWEATGVVQVGAVGQSGAGQLGQLVESPARAIERTKMRGFQNDVLATLKTPNDDLKPIGELFRGSIKVKQLQNTDFLEIRLRAYSPDEAKRWLEATVKQLDIAHQRLAAPSIERLRKQLEEVDQNLRRARKTRDGLQESVSRRSLGPGERFAESVYNANLLVQTNGEVRALEAERAMMLEQLSPTRTYPTALVERIYVSERPVSPRTGLIVALATLVGLLAGIFIAYFLDGRDAARGIASTRG